MRLAATMTNVLLVHHTEKLYTALYVHNFQEKKLSKGQLHFVGSFVSIKKTRINDKTWEDHLKSTISDQDCMRSLLNVST